MSAPTNFELKPLSKMMKFPAITFLMFAAVQTHAQAAHLIGESKVIDARELKNDWQLDHKSDLTVNGARTGNILVNDSTLSVNTGSLVDDIRATQGSNVSLDGATVESNNTTFGAMRLDDSTAVIKGSSISSNTTVGLQAFQNFDSPKGGLAQVYEGIGF